MNPISSKTRRPVVPVLRPPQQGLPAHLAVRRADDSRGAAGRRDPRGPGRGQHLDARLRHAASASRSSGTSPRARATRSASGCNLLGLMTEELDESTSQIAHGETVRETATMISFLTEVIGIRDDMFLGEGHKYMTRGRRRRSARASQQGVLLQRPGGGQPPVRPRPPDAEHGRPACTWRRTSAALDALKGKKLAMTLGLLAELRQAALGAAGHRRPDDALRDERRARAPGGLRPGRGAAAEAARRFAAASGGSFSVASSMEDAFEDADIVYPKSWAPARVMHERTQAPARRRDGEAGRPRTRGAGQQRALQGLGVHRRADDAHARTGGRSTCTACRPTSRA